MEEKKHWKKSFNPEYIGAYAFNPGEEKVGTIATVREEPVIGADGKKETCLVARFKERDLLPLILNVTNCKTITKIYKTPYIEDWIGKQIIMQVKQVKAFGDVVDAVRVKNEKPRTAPAQEIVCEQCGQILKPFGTMDVKQLADYTQKKYGKHLCADCAKDAADKAKEDSNNA